MAVWNACPARIARDNRVERLGELLFESLQPGGPAISQPAPRDHRAGDASEHRRQRLLDEQQRDNGKHQCQHQAGEGDRARRNHDAGLLDQSRERRARCTERLVQCRQRTDLALTDEGRLLFVLFAAADFLEPALHATVGKRFRQSQRPHAGACHQRTDHDKDEERR